MNSTRGMKGKYGLKDKKEMVGGRRIYGQKRGIIALAHGDGVEERQHKCFLAYYSISNMYNNIDKKTFTYHHTPAIIFVNIYNIHRYPSYIYFPTSTLLPAYQLLPSPETDCNL